MAGTVGRSVNGIDFAALDHQPVYSVVLLLSPDNQPQQHLQAHQPPQRAARGGGQARKGADEQGDRTHQHDGLQRGPGEAFQQQGGQLIERRHLTSPCAWS